MTLLEGCIGETLSLACLVEQFELATDPAIRMVLGEIVADEVRHVALAWDTARWMVHRDEDHVQECIEDLLADLDAFAPAAFGAEGPAEQLNAHGILTIEQGESIRSRTLDEALRPLLVDLLEKQSRQTA